MEDYKFLGEYLLIPCDGTGMFSSDSVHCENCCEKHHKDGKVTYYHQMLGAVVVHPDQREVFPLCPEPILQQLEVWTFNYVGFAANFGSSRAPCARTMVACSRH